MKTFFLFFLSIIVSFLFTSCTQEEMTKVFDEVGIPKREYAEPEWMTTCQLHEHKFTVFGKFTSDSLLVTTEGVPIIDFISSSLPVRVKVLGTEKAEKRLVKYQNCFGEDIKDSLFVSLDNVSSGDTMFIRGFRESILIKEIR
jgi:hypothetical protein